MNHNQTIITFDSIHQVLKAEQLLLKQKVAIDIIPTPKSISTNCGMSIRVSDDKNLVLIKSILEKQGLSFTVHNI
jgi:hypothetical protein